MILSESQLEAWGRLVGATVEPPAFFALHGDLGAGKSVFARAVARGAGVQSDMPSPTFNLLFRYDAAGGVEVLHLDLYRLEFPHEVWELGWRELGGEHEIVLVEWPERAGTLLPEDRWDVQLTVVSAELRKVVVTPSGSAPPLPQPPSMTPEAGT